MTSVLALNDPNPPGAREAALCGTKTLVDAERNRREAGTRLRMRGYALAIAAPSPLLTTEQAWR